MSSLNRSVLLSVLFGIASCLGGGSVAQALTCTPSATTTCYTFTNPGSIGVSVPFGSVEVDSFAGGLHFIVDVSPNFDITAGNAHEAFSFAIGTSPGTLTNSGHIDASSIVQNGGTGVLGVDPQNGSPFQNSPFGLFNFGLVCSPNGGSQNCGQSFSFNFLFTSTGGLIPSTLDPSIWFAADICVPAAGGGCSATGAAGASAVAVPAPIVGAGLPGLIAACGGLLALARRRRQKIA